MADNLYEWVEDCYDKDAYKRRQNKTITNPRNNTGVCPSGGRVLRGGSFYYGPGLSAGVESGRVSGPGTGTGYDGFRCSRASMLGY